MHEQTSKTGRAIPGDTRKTDPAAPDGGTLVNSRSSRAMNDVYVLVSDHSCHFWVIRVPDSAEESAFRAEVEEETGLTTHGVAFLTTTQLLKRELGRRKRQCRLTRGFG